MSIDVPIRLNICNIYERVCECVNASVDVECAEMVSALSTRRTLFNYYAYTMAIRMEYSVSHLSRLGGCSVVCIRFRM